MFTKPTAYPLRKISDVVSPPVGLYSRQQVRLECGHLVWCSGYAIYRARCRFCGRDAAK